MNVNELRKKAVEFCERVNSKCTPRGKEISTDNLKKRKTLSPKAKKVQDHIQSDVFGCNSEAVAELVSILLDEKIEYGRSELYIRDTFENPYRKKRFYMFSVVQCIDIDIDSKDDVESIFLVINKGAEIDYPDTEIEIINYNNDILYVEKCDDRCDLELATPEQMKRFFKKCNKSFFEETMPFLEFI